MGKRSRDAVANVYERVGARNSALWVPETLHTSRDLLIFVDQSTDLVASSDVVDLGCCAVGEWS
jgi:hypothetical protein